jgi:maltodextrin utilization protein YvdJ
MRAANNVKNVPSREKELLGHAAVLLNAVVLIEHALRNNNMEEIKSIIDEALSIPADKEVMELLQTAYTETMTTGESNEQP